MTNEKKPLQVTREQLVSRRRFIGVATGALAVPILAPGVLAQEIASPAAGTPVASQASVTLINEDALYDLSQKLVGGGSLSRDAVGPLAKLISEDANLAAGFTELTKLADPTSDEAQRGLSANARTVSTNILLYWYTGYFGNNPVENRADILFGLPVWSTVPYVTQPTVCKGFGYWANEVKIGGRATPEAQS